MGRSFALAIAALALLLPSCLTPRYQIDTSNVVDAVNMVTGRVERYAAADASLSPSAAAEISADIASSRQQVAQPAADQRVLAPPLLRVCDRHDVYVANDVALVPLERTIYLQSTARLRALLKPPG